MAGVGYGLDGKCLLRVPGRAQSYGLAHLYASARHDGRRWSFCSVPSVRSRFYSSNVLSLSNVHMHVNLQYQIGRGSYAAVIHLHLLSYEVCSGTLQKNVRWDLRTLPKAQFSSDMCVYQWRR